MTLRRLFAVLYVIALLGSGHPPPARPSAPQPVRWLEQFGTRQVAVLPNVAITVAGDALMGVRPASTAADGTFRIAALPPGDYAISFSLPGFNTHQHGVSVALGFTTTLDVELAVGAHEERLTVAARSGVLDRQSTAITETFDAGQLADLPGSRSMSALFEVAKGVVTPTAEGGSSVGSIGGSGSTGAYGTRGSNRPTIEGIVVSGINFGGLTIDYGSFEQASVLTGSHGAEWANAGCAHSARRQVRGESVPRHALR